MTDDQEPRLDWLPDDVLERYLDQIAFYRWLTGVPHVQVCIKHQPLDDGEDVWACVLQQDGFEMYQMWLSPRLHLDVTPAGQRAVLLHEVLHLQHRDLNDAVAAYERALKPLGKAVVKPLHANYYEHAERMVDRLQRAFMRTLREDDKWVTGYDREGVFLEGYDTPQTDDEETSDG